MREWPHLSSVGTSRRVLRPYRREVGLAGGLYTLPGMSEKSWQDEYSSQASDYERVREEAVYVLNKRIDARGIKLHSLNSRVKELASLEAKAERKGYSSPLEETPDVVGIRVVVLFRADIGQVGEIVDSEFDVVDNSDTVTGADDPSTFGYMSQHFVARLPSTLVGPRYEGLNDYRFEVQVRTILMDAWANVSHYLAYKNESSIPAELRRDFDALSGLFYVADSHFELFSNQTRLVREEADQQLAGNAHEVPLNLDTLTAFFQQHFPDRSHTSRAGVADLVAELLEFGFKTVGDVQEMLTAAEDLFLAHEREEPPRRVPGGRFADVGVVRISLRETNPKYRAYLEKKVRSYQPQAPRSEPVKPAKQ